MRCLRLSLFAQNSGGRFFQGFFVRAVVKPSEEILKDALQAICDFYSVEENSSFVCRMAYLCYVNVRKLCKRHKDVTDLETQIMAKGGSTSKS